MAAAIALWKSGEKSIPDTWSEGPIWTSALAFSAMGLMSANLGIQGVMAKRLNTQFGTTRTFLHGSARRIPADVMSVVLTTVMVEVRPSCYADFLRKTHLGFVGFCRPQALPTCQPRSKSKDACFSLLILRGTLGSCTSVSHWCRRMSWPCHWVEISRNGWVAASPFRDLRPELQIKFLEYFLSRDLTCYLDFYWHPVYQVSCYIRTTDSSN